MRQTTIWDFLPQESSIEAKQTNQRNTMEFKSLEDIFEYIRMHQPKSDSAGTEPITPNEAGESDDNSDDNSDECIDCQLDYLETRESLLLAYVNVAILDVMNNTLNQEAPIRNEQADTLVKLAQVKSILGSC